MTIHITLLKFKNPSSQGCRITYHHQLYNGILSRVVLDLGYLFEKDPQKFTNLQHQILQIMVNYNF